MGPPLPLPGGELGHPPWGMELSAVALVRSVCPNLGQSGRDTGSTEHTRWPVSLLGSRHASGQGEHDMPPFRIC